MFLALDTNIEGQKELLGMSFAENEGAKFWLNVLTKQKNCGLNDIFYPADIRKVIYTTNAIESLNSVIRHAIKKRKVFPTDDSVKKVVWLAVAKMDDATEGLAYGNESLFYRVR